MSADSRPPRTVLNLTAGFDRSRAWARGRSVRYLVAELSARGPDRAGGHPLPLNLALVIDVSGSMAGSKIEAARGGARAVAGALTPSDRLSIIAFDDASELLLDARPMDDDGRTAADAAIARLAVGGGTDLFGGWMLAAERVALAMGSANAASHRVLLLSDGQANRGMTERSEIAGHVGALLERGVVTSALGIGNGYDEEMLGTIAEAGGGHLHDAADAPEIGELVLGELKAGLAALAERVTLRLAFPPAVRADVVGAWAHTVSPGMIAVTAGSLLPDQAKRIVFRLRCPADEPGTVIPLGVSADCISPDDGAPVEAPPLRPELRLANGMENNAQARDVPRSVAVVTAWQGEAIRRAAGMNGRGEGQAAKHFLERELRWLEPYARGLPGTEALIAELVLVHRQVTRTWDARTRKEVFAASRQRSRSEHDPRSMPRASISERFQVSPNAP